MRDTEISFNDMILRKISALGLDGPAGKNTDGNAPGYIKKQILNLKKKTFMDPKIKEKATQLIDDEFLLKVCVLRYDNVKKEINFLPLVGPDVIAGEDEKKDEQLRQNCFKLQKALKSFAQGSDEAAYFITKCFANPYFSFSLADDETLEKMKFNKNSLGAYYPEWKTILIPISSLEDNSINSSAFLEILSHEFAHAADDLAVIDTLAKKSGEVTILSRDALKEKIKPFLEKELKNNKNLLENLLYMRKEEIKKENPNISDGELNKKLIESIKKRPMYRIDASSEKEMELVKKSTWCWHELVKGTVTVPLISYLEENLNVNTQKDSNRLVMEYIGYGVQFVLSGDKTKMERLKKQDAAFYEFLTNEFIPCMTT